MAGENDNQEGKVEGQAELTPDQVFENTFAELSLPDNAPKVHDKAETEAEQQHDGQEPGALPTPEEAAAAEAERVAAEAAAAAGKDGKVEGQQQGQQPSIEELLRKALQKPEPTEAERQAAALAQQEAERQAAARQAAEDRNKIPDYTEDQKRIIDEYEKTFPEVSAAEEIKRSREYHAVTGYIFGEVGKVLSQQAETIRQQGLALQHLMGQTAQQTIKEKVGDIAPLKPQIEAWIAEQPKFLQGTYNHIMKEGTTEDVIGLVQQFKTAKGIKDPEPTAPRAQEPTRQAGAAAATKVDPPRQVPPVQPKVPAGLRPVTSSRTQVVEGGVARDDFEGAFDTFAKAATGR